MEYSFSNEFFTLSYHTASNAIYLRWLKPPATPEDYKSAFIKGTDALIEYNATGWLADVTNQGAVSPENRQWVETEILPKGVQGGLRKIAIIITNEDVFKKYYLEQLKKSSKSEGVLGMQYFKSLDEALLWLKKK